MVEIENLLKTADEIAEKMKEKGYEYFNVKHGATGTDLRTGISVYLRNASFNDVQPVFPIYAGAGVAATTPDNPYTRATFKIVEDGQKGLRIAAMGLSMYECFDGALRTSLELKIKSLDDVPTKQEAAKLIEEKWKRHYQANQLTNSFNRTGMLSKGNFDFVFEQYKGHIIASHKDNVAGEDIDNLIIVYRSDEYPNHGFIIGLDDRKSSGARKTIPHNIDDAKAYIDWLVKKTQENKVDAKAEIPKPQKSRGRKI